MKPARPATSTASGNGINPLREWPLASPSISGAWGTWPDFRNDNTRTPAPIAPLIAAATATDPDIPRVRMVTSAATKQAVAEPNVLTKYSVPTLLPTWPDRRTRYAVNSGSVPPIRVVGITTRPKVTRPVVI